MSDKIFFVKILDDKNRHRKKYINAGAYSHLFVVFMLLLPFVHIEFKIYRVVNVITAVRRRKNTPRNGSD